MGLHESKSSSAASSSAASASSSGCRGHHRYTLIASKALSSGDECDASMEPEVENNEELAVCLASISLMALTGEGTNVPRRSFSSSSTTYDHQKKPSASCGRSSEPSAASPTSAAAAAAAAPASVRPSSSSSKTKLFKKLLLLLKRRSRRHHSSEDDCTLPAAAADHLSKHIHFIDSLQDEEDESSDWASMRSWLLWCLQNKLGDEDNKSMTSDDTVDFDDFICYPDTPNSFIAASSDHVRHHLRRQCAVQERPRIVASSRVLRRQETSFDDGPICSGQSSFESSGSARNE